MPKRRIPIFDVEQDGRELARVPLAKSAQSAVLYREDFDALMAAGVSDQWRIWMPTFGSLKVYAYSRVTRRDVFVAREILDASPFSVISYLNGNPFDLRRPNLTIDKVWPPAVRADWEKRRSESRDFQKYRTSLARDLESKVVSSNLPPMPFKNE